MAGQEHLWKSLLVLGIVLSMISFLPSYILSTYDDPPEGYSVIHLLQCSENPYLIVTMRHPIPISLYFMTLEESLRFIDGTPIENVTIAFSLMNISEYSGPVNLGAPGMYVLLVRSFNQSNHASSRIYVLHRIPQLRVLGTSMIFLVLGILIRYYPYTKLVLWSKKRRRFDNNEKQFIN
jgi:hypothetical protein